jgi:hypothetical protein
MYLTLKDFVHPSRKVSFAKKSVNLQAVNFSAKGFGEKDNFKKFKENNAIPLQVAKP